MALIPNKMLLNILACGLIICSPLLAASGSNWKSLTEPKNSFSVSFPTEPEHIEQRIDIPRSDLSISYNTYISEPNEDAVYVVSVWNYPSEIDMSKPEVNLQDGFSGMLSALPGSEVVSMQKGEQQGFKTLDFLVKNDDIFFQGRLILVYNTLYQVFAVYKEEVMLTQDYNHFINSFQLINVEQQKVDNKKRQKMNV